MSKSKEMFADYQEEQAMQIGFIGRNNNAHYKGQDLLNQIQASRIKLDCLKKEIANAYHSEQAEDLRSSAAYFNLKLKAQEEKSNLCALLDMYRTGIEKMLEAASREQYDQLQAPIEPKSHTNLVAA